MKCLADVISVTAEEFSQVVLTSHVCWPGKQARRE